MDEFAKSNDIVLLLDNYFPDSRDLHTSFQQAGIECPVVVIEDNGFLPENVISVYGSFLGGFRGKKGIPGKPRYFNQITVPEYWEISGTNSMGKIHDLYRERGRIFYAEPLHKRLVRVVDWRDENNKVRSSDHYNRYGALYARTTFNAKEQKVNKTYFSADGREVIVENYVTGDIILNERNKVKFFPTKTDFVKYFLKKTGLAERRIFFNSLSTPFFVSQRLTSKTKRDILFWQEPERNDIPGNMQVILNGKASRTAKILVQKKQSYEKLLELGVSPEIVHKLGFLYAFKKENQHHPEALICTNSDQIEHCVEIVKAIPEMHFHIAAITEMSSKLLSVGEYDNVSLYPGIKTAILDGLFEQCDYYLDINHAAEIVSAVYRAFLHNHLIFAFRETIHNTNYIAQEHIYPIEKAEQMISDIRMVMTDAERVNAELKKQKDAAFAETVERYMKLTK